MKVQDVMTTTLITVEPEAAFKDVVELLLDHEVSGLPVVDRDGHLLGIVTEADLMSKEAFGGHRRALAVLADFAGGNTRWASKANGLTAAAVMTTDLVTARPDEDIQAAARRMLTRGVKRLPVVEDGRLVGVVSRPDLLRIFHRSDADIAAEIDAKLANPVWAPEDHKVTFRVVDGVVTLEGSVTFEGEVPVIVGLAQRVAGVVEVIDRLDWEYADGS